jgi:hypothetical protein
MMSSTAWGMPCLIVCHATHGHRQGSILSLCLALYLHCNPMLARLAGINYTACLHILKTHDGPDVWRLGNRRMCIGNLWV